MKFHYSEKEIELIKAFNCEHIIESVDPVNMYEIMMKKAFRENMSGTHVESLRRCINALYSCKIYRETPEWDKMIRFGNDTPLETINLPVRAKTLIDRYFGFKYIEEFITLSAFDLICSKNIGKKTLSLIIKELKKAGFQLKETPEEDKERMRRYMH